IACEFDITACYTVTGGRQLLTSPSLCNIFTRVPPTPDPLAYLPVPSQPDAANVLTKGNKVAPTYTNYSYTLPDGTVKTYNNVYILAPGSYGGPSEPKLPNFTKGDLIILQQSSAGNNGIYYFTAGGFQTQNSGLLKGSPPTGGLHFLQYHTGNHERVKIHAHP